jgi:hypothetical protein
MKRLTKISWLLMALTLLGLSACGGGSTAATQTVDSVSVFTQIASTALALQTQTVLAMPTATSTPPVPPTPETTNTPLVTDTPLPVATSAPATTPATTPATATPLALNTPLATSQASCDNMAYVADVTIPDGYVAARGESMKKTWTLKNLGPCTWTQNYKFAYGWGGQGTNWSTTPPVNLSKVVAPGGTIEVTVTLTAPSAAGEYVAVFKLQNDKGFFFPKGQQVTIDIVVK